MLLTGPGFGLGTEPVSNLRPFNHLTRLQVEGKITGEQKPRRLGLQKVKESERVCCRVNRYNRKVSRVTREWTVCRSRAAN